MALFRFAFRAMACDNEILVHAAARAQVADAAEVAIAEVKRIEAKYSRYRDDSIVSQINRAAGHYPVAIDAETQNLLAYADACFTQSDGLFDITSGVLRHAWNFRSGTLPSAAAVATLVARVGWRRVERHDGAVFLPSTGMELDFGGFGKEYAVDRACELLRAHGVDHALVNLGGDMRATGPQSDGSAWRVGIRHPRRDGELLARVDLPGGALATSGDYERFMIVNGVRYAHVLDPRTGWPVTQTFQSVSARADVCLLAGSTTTIALLKGEVAGQQWLDEMACPYLAVTCLGEVKHRVWK
mgnify:CR=1 FL=1